MRLKSFALLLFALLLAGPAAAFSDGDRLKQLNETSLAAYAAGRSELLSRAGPVIIVGADVTFLVDGKETHADYTPAIYTTLKSLSHLFLGAVGILQPYMDDGAAGEAQWRPHLEAIRREALAVEPHLEALGLAGDSLARNRVAIERLVAFIDGVLAEGNYSRAELTEMARGLAPFMLANAYDAARAQIDSLHAAVQAWRAERPPEDWDRVRVFVLGPRMPRQDNLQFTYFRLAMGEAAVDRRLIYAENVFSQEGAMKLLGTILADRTLAEITFGDEMRMDRDLLGDAAKAYLLQLFGALGQARP